jgi:hypothetical protein
MGVLQNGLQTETFPRCWSRLACLMALLRHTLARPNTSRLHSSTVPQLGCLRKADSSETHTRTYSRTTDAEHQVRAQNLRWGSETCQSGHEMDITRTHSNRVQRWCGMIAPHSGGSVLISRKLFIPRFSLGARIIRVVVKPLCTSRKVAGSRPNELTGFFFNLPNPSGRTRH